MKTPPEIIAQLSPNDALTILKTLANSDEQIAGRIAEMAMNNLSRVDPEAEATALYDALNFLEVEDVWDRAGLTRDGYVEPHQAAEEMVAELIEPYLDQLKKYQKLGLNAQVNKLCMGLLWGLYQFEYESTSEFKNWASGAAEVFAEEAINVWKSGSPSKADIAEVENFIEGELWRWQTHLVRGM